MVWLESVWRPYQSLKGKSDSQLVLHLRLSPTELPRKTPQELQTLHFDSFLPSRGTSGIEIFLFFFLPIIFFCICVFLCKPFSKTRVFSSQDGKSPNSHNLPKLFLRRCCSDSSGGKSIPMTWLWSVCLILKVIPPPDSSRAIFINFICNFLKFS